VHALVCSLPAESAPRRGNDAGARCICRPHQRASLGYQNVADVGSSFPAAQTTRGPKLEDGRDLHQSIQWKYLYRAVDRAGDTVDFLLTAKRDLAAARRFLERAINLHDVPEKITIDKSGANTAVIESVKADACVDILMRQNKYLNNIVEQNHRAIKRVTRPMLGFKSFLTARIVIAGIETMHMIRKGQLNCPAGSTASAADQFYGLAF